ncbi:MAG: SdrD B-like domain-containing protein, partial [Pseudomonadota bacterium]|nr:SdrD B-like domain-containing protein [Pseudomonadota bacterium]
YVSGSGLWTVGGIAKDASASLSIIATVKASGAYANTAEVTAANETDSDSTPNNQNALEDDQKTVTPVPTALIDLSLNKTASNMTPQVGSNLTFTVSVANAGPSNATGVVVTDLLPSGYTFVSATPSQGSYVSGTGLWTISSIAKDASASLSIIATVKAGGAYANTAEVTAANETDSDSTPNNQNASEDDQKTVTPVPLAGLSGKVYLDRNDNGSVDADETGFPGVTIRLSGKDDLGDSVDLTVLTDADGIFRFADLRPSDSNGYTLTETQPSSYLDGRESVGVVGGVVSGTAPNTGFDDTPANNRITGIHLGAGQSGSDYLFGERGARLNGYVYVDVNGNGGKDAGETGLTGIPVTLSGTTADGVNICTLLACATTTNADGAYAFAGLPVGTYTLVEDQTVVNQIVGADGKPLYTDGKETAGVAGGEVVNNYFGSQEEYNRIRNINLTQALMTSLNGDVTGYLFGEVPRAANPLVLKPPIVNGYVWLDRDHSRQRPVDGSMEGLSGWSVGLFQSQTLLCTVNTDGGGFYQFDNLHCPGYENGLPISSSPRDFSISFSKASNRLANVPISGGGAGEVKQGEIVGITLRDGDEITEQNLPLDPSGIVYDAVTRQPVAGATVRIDYLGAGAFDPAAHLLGGTASQVQVTGADGLYAFFLQNAYPSGEYLLTVAAPAGYLNATSVMIPVCTGIIDALALPTPLLVQGSNVPPPAGTPLHNAATCPSRSAAFTTVAPWAGGQETTQYYFRFNITNGVSAHILNNHIPVDPLQGGNIVMTKTTPLINVSRGDLVPYTITARNTLPGALAAIDIQDLIPPGFKYKQGSASFDDDCDGPLPAVSMEPNVNVRTLTWANHAFTASGTVQACKRIKLMLVVGAGVGEGEYNNQTWSMNSVANVQISNTAVATVRVVPDPTFDCTDIIGKVFDDQNANGYQDEGEPGIPNVRVATARGLLVTTDKEGRFHVACAVIPQAQRGSNFIMKLDERSLPSGYRLTTENPRDVRATRGKLVKLNFGAAIHRVVRVELTDAAFISGKPEATAALAKALDKLPQSLRAKPSVVRLAYQSRGEARNLIEDRLRAVRERLERLWKEQGCCYTLVFEEEVFERPTGKKRGAK